MQKTTFISGALQRDLISSIRWRTASALSVAMVLATMVVMPQSAQAQKFRALYAFPGGVDGGEPRGGLVRDSSGNLYGTTSAIDTSVGGLGTIFKVDPTGQQTVLYTFSGSDGENPYAGLVRDAAGNFYGTTLRGGVYSLGTVFKLDTSDHETVLYSFSGPDGATPAAALLLNAATGSLYGTTSRGGANGQGTVFVLNAAGVETVLHSFSGPDGANPQAELIQDPAGNLYGTTWAGGAQGFGTVFKLDTAGQETVLYSFSGFPDGNHPAGGLVRDASGDLYGTTAYGGRYVGYVLFGGFPSSLGTIFKLDPTGHETVLHSFNVADGAIPVGTLVRDAAGNLYGATLWGGRGPCFVMSRGRINVGPFPIHRGCGTVFKLKTTGKETVLHSFKPTDGENPWASLIRDAKGNLYGTAFDSGGAVGTVSFGTVFKLKP